MDPTPSPRIYRPFRARGGWPLSPSAPRRPSRDPPPTGWTAAKRRNRPTHRAPALWGHLLRGDRGHGRISALLPGLLVALALAPTAYGDELGRVLEERSRANAASTRSQERIDELSDATEQLLSEYRQVRKQIDSLAVYNEQLESLVATQDEERASLKRQIDGVAVIGRQVPPLLLDMLEALEQFIALDVPFLLEERRGRVASLRDMMGRVDVADSEKFRRVLEAYQTEADYGRTLEAYEGEIERKGARRRVSFLRVGRVALLFQSLDGEELGAWDASQRNWVELPDSYRRALRQGLRMANKQAAPDLLELPMPLPGGPR